MTDFSPGPYLQPAQGGKALPTFLCVILYLQREIRAERRNIGALKVSNLLHRDRFEEDLNLSRVRLSAPPPAKTPMALRPPTCSPAQQERGRQRALEQLRQLKETLR
jgi:hypothetical protein